MTWPLQGSLADILDYGPDPSDPPDDAEAWALLDELERAARRKIFSASSRAFTPPTRARPVLRLIEGSLSKS
jgi:hypothetical protein